MARSSLIPGFRFHPTDVELVMFYLKKKLMGKNINVNVVEEVNIYDFSPWDLPDKSSLRSGDLEWYFFCPKARKYSSGGRYNRATETGFWKATGKDRKVEYKERTVATIKTLVFHQRDDGNGKRTNWVMHEYRMEDEQLASAGIVLDTYVLCKVFEKSGAGPKNGAQYGAPFNEEEWDDDLAQPVVGPFGASITTDHKQKGPAASYMTGPGSSAVTCSAKERTNTMIYKQNGQATTNMTQPVSSIATLPAIEPTNSPTYKQKGPTTTDRTEPGSSIVTVSTNEPTNSVDYKQKGKATANMIVSQTTHGLFVTEPGSSSALLSPDEMPACNEDVLFSEDIMAPNNEMPPGNEDVMFLADIMPPNKDDGIYDDGFLNDLQNWRSLAYLKPHRDTIDELLICKDPLEDPLDLGNFYVD